MEDNPNKKFDNQVNAFVNEIKDTIDKLEGIGPFKMIQILENKFPEKIDCITDEDRKEFPFIDDLGDKLDASHLIISILAKFRNMGHKEGEVLGAINAAEVTRNAASETQRQTPEHEKLVVAIDNTTQSLIRMQKYNSEKSAKIAELLVRVINQIVEIRMRETAKVSNN